MTLQSDRFKVGVFLLVSAFLFIAFFGFFIGRAVLKPTRTYTIRFKETVKGLSRGSRVNYHGVPVGTVTGMRLEGDTTVVEVQLDPSLATVQKGVTKAYLERNPLTGLATVELEGWKEGAPELPGGGEIPAGPSWGSELMNTLPEIMRDLSASLKNIQRAAAAVNDLLGPETRRRFRDMLVHLDELSRKLPETLDRMDLEGRKTMASLRSAAERLSAGVERLEKEVRFLSGEARSTLAETRKTLVSGRRLLEGKDTARLIASAADAARALDRTLAETRRFLEETKGILRRGEYDLLPLADRLAATAEAVQRLASMLERAPDSLMWGKPVPERTIRSGEKGGGR